MARWEKVFSGDKRADINGDKRADIIEVNSFETALFFVEKRKILCYNIFTDGYALTGGNDGAGGVMGLITLLGIALILVKSKAKRVG